MLSTLALLTHLQFWAQSGCMIWLAGTRSLQHLVHKHHISKHLRRFCLFPFLAMNCRNFIYAILLLCWACPVFHMVLQRNKSKQELFHSVAS